MKNLLIIALFFVGCKTTKPKTELKGYQFNSDSSIVYFDCTFVHPIGRVPHNVPLPIVDTTIYFTPKTTSEYWKALGTKGIDSLIRERDSLIKIIYGTMIPIDSFNKDCDMRFFPVIIDSVIYNQLSGIGIVPGKIYSIPVDKAGRIFVKE